MMTSEKILTYQNGSAGFLFFWAVWAMNPYSGLFVRLPVLYARMSSLMDEFYWGLLMLNVSIMAGGLSYFGRRHQAAFLLGVAFMLFSSLYFMADPASPGGILYGWIAFFNFLYYVANTRWFKF